MNFAIQVVAYLLLAGAIVGMTYSLNSKLLDWVRFRSLGTRDFILERLSSMFIRVTPEKVLLWQVAVIVIPSFIVFLIFIPLWLPATVFALSMAIAGWLIPKPIVEFIYRKRVEKFTRQMIDGLGLMSNGLKSGLSIPQAMGIVVQEMDNPIRQEFELVLNENRVGLSLEDSFNNLSRRVQSDDVEMFVTSINILKETGGNLAETFDTISDTIRERIKIEAKIGAMTAQGFYQGMIVMAIPPILGVVFYFSDPEMMMPLFESTAGWLIIFTILALELVGFFMIMKITKIDV